MQLRFEELLELHPDHLQFIAVAQHLSAQVPDIGIAVVDGYQGVLQRPHIRAEHWDLVDALVESTQARDAALLLRAIVMDAVIFVVADCFIGVVVVGVVVGVVVTADAVVAIVAQWACDVVAEPEEGRSR